MFMWVAEDAEAAKCSQVLVGPSALELESALHVKQGFVPWILRRAATLGVKRSSPGAH